MQEQQQQHRLQEGSTRPSAVGAARQLASRGMQHVFCSVLQKFIAKRRGIKKKSEFQGQAQKSPPTTCTASKQYNQNISESYTAAQQHCTTPRSRTKRGRESDALSVSLTSWSLARLLVSAFLRTRAENCLQNSPHPQQPPPPPPPSSSLITRVG